MTLAALPRTHRIHRAAIVVVVALACLALYPPPVLEGFATQLEVSLGTLVAALLLVITSPRPVHSVVLPAPLLALLVVMGASVLWSISRSQTIHDIAIVGVLLAAAILLVSVADLDLIAIGVVAAAVFVLLWSAVAVIVDAHHSLTPVGAFNGVYGNRNALAFIMLQGVAAALSLRGLTSRVRFVPVAAIVALSVAILFTRSITSIAVLLVLLLVVAFVSLVRVRIALVALAAVCLAAVVVVLANSGRILETLGKGDSINGRVPVWEALLPVIADRPVVGYGWSLAWPRGGPASAAASEALDGIVLFHAHNEILNWFVTTGVIGVILVLVAYASVLVVGVRLLRRNDRTGWWLVTGGLALLLRGLADISETAPQGWFVLSVLAAAAAASLVGETKPLWRRQSLVVPLGPPADRG